VNSTRQPPGLLRRIGLLSATALVVSNMVGTGIFTTTGFLAGDLGSPVLVLLSWIVGAGCALLAALCYAELGLNFPVSGGEYLYLSRAYGPIWGFLSGWASFFAGFSAPIAATSLACADYLGSFVPTLRLTNAPVLIHLGGWALRFGATQIFACSLIGILTVVNVFGVQRVARLQNALTALKLLVLGAFLVMGFAWGHGNWAHLGQTAIRSTTTPLFGQFAVSLFWIYVSYSGWNAAVYVAEELKSPERTLPRALMVGTAIVAVLYLSLNVLFLYALPLESMKGVLAIGASTATALFGDRASGLFRALMAASLLATINAMVLTGPRVYLAMARDGMFFSRAAHVHPRWRTPVAAILAQGVFAMALTLTPFPQLIIYIGFTLNFFAAMAVGSLFLFRRRPGWRCLPAVSFGFPATPAISLTIGIWMAWEGFRLRPAISLTAVGVLAMGALVYFFQNRKRKYESVLKPGPPRPTINL
jgi:APA family basic amino acid/polyamine antiporter